MESLVVVYITAEQERAVRDLYHQQCWIWQNLGDYLTEALKESIQHVHQSLSKANTNPETLGRPFTLDCCDQCGPDQTASNKTEPDRFGGHLQQKKLVISETEVCVKTKDTLDQNQTESNYLDRTDKTTKKLGTRNESKQASCDTVDSSEQVKQACKFSESVKIAVNLTRPNLRRSGRKSCSFNLNKDSTSTYKSKSNDEIRLNNETSNRYRKRSNTKTSCIENIDQSDHIANTSERPDHGENSDKNRIENTAGADDGNCSTQNVKSKKLQTDPGKQNTNESSSPDLKKQRYECKHCEYSSFISSNYLRHVREVHNKIRHQCSQCDKSFKSKHEAKSHFQNAHVKSLKCVECEKTFTSRGGLLNHNKQVHQNKALYKCDQCDATFFYKQHYIGHVNRHNSNKPFSCTSCSKPFSYKSSLNIHEKRCNGGNFFDSHNGDGSLKIVEKSKLLCDICGDELSSKSSLRTHHRYVHSNEPRRVCSVCGKSFKGRYSLQRHLQISHTEMKDQKLPCEVCGRVFNQKQVLAQHMKRHKREFSVYCSTCGKGFYSNFKLREHERTHTGERPYSCPICHEFKCSSKTNLQKHLKTHKPGKRTGSRKQAAKSKTATPHSAAPTSNQASHIGRHVTVPMTTSECETTAMISDRDEHVPNSSTFIQHVHSMNVAGVMSRDSNNIPNSMHVQHSRMSDYDQPQWGMTLEATGGYDNRHEVGYHDNRGESPNDQLSQGLNILTAAMNLVNPGPY